LGFPAAQRRLIEKQPGFHHANGHNAHGGGRGEVIVANISSTSALRSAYGQLSASRCTNKRSHG
jgi:hypothetical protein